MYLYLTQATKESDSKKRTLKRVQKGYPDPLFFLDFGPVQKGYPDVLMSHINVLIFLIITWMPILTLQNGRV